MSQRRGANLIELMTVVALTGVLLAGACTLLTSLFHTQRQIQRDLEGQRMLARLQTRLRGDVHAARSAHCETPARCELDLGDGSSVIYEVTPRYLSRTLRRGDVREHFDTFPLPAESQTTLAVPGERQGVRSILRLTIASNGQPTTANTPPVRPAVIDAVIDLHGQAIVPQEGAP